MTAGGDIPEGSPSDGSWSSSVYGVLGVFPEAAAKISRIDIVEVWHRGDEGIIVISFMNRQSKLTPFSSV